MVRWTHEGGEAGSWAKGVGGVGAEWDGHRPMTCAARCFAGFPAALTMHLGGPQQASHHSSRAGVRNFGQTMPHHVYYVCRRVRAAREISQYERCDGANLLYNCVPYVTIDLELVSTIAHVGRARWLSLFAFTSQAPFN